MKLLHILLLLLVPLSIFAQGPDDCELVTIECCDFNLTRDTLTIQASNQSSNIFSYPGFILFDNNMDTIAIETVNYYGIGSYPQPHKLEIVAPLNIPFEGYLELHTLFFEEYACTFPLNIADTTTVGIDENILKNSISVYPNPAGSFVNICFDEIAYKPGLSITIIDFIGRQYYSNQLVQSGQIIPVGHFRPGIYSVLVSDNNNQFIFTDKLIIK
jgi:hypothetical protein